MRKKIVITAIVIILLVMFLGIVIVGQENVKPSDTATAVPTSTIEPTVEPTIEPTVEPTKMLVPTLKPTIEPTVEPTKTPVPTVKTTKTPTPTKKSTKAPVVTKTPEVTKAPLVTKAPVATKKPTGTDNKGLRVVGTNLVDSNGNKVVLRGVSTHGLSWYPQYVNKELFRELKNNWKVNTIRLAMYTDEYNGYCVGVEENKKQLKKLVKDGVAYATELNMYVIIDWHILNDQNPNKYKNQSIEFFDEMSKEYSKYDNVIYEICNEPNGGTTWEDIKSYANDVIKVIRKNSPNAIIIVGTPTWSQDVDVVAKSPLKYENILYALHFYADTHRDYLRDKLQRAINKKLPVIVSEFGICDASGQGAVNTKEADKWMKLLADNSIGYCVWNMSNKQETCALIRSDVSKTSGFTRDDLSESGRWFYDMQNKK